jgi:hypothetical protein
VPGHPPKGRLHLEHGAVTTHPDHRGVTGHSAGLNAAPAPLVVLGAAALMAWTVLIVEGAGVVMLLLTAALLWQRR